MEIGDGPGFRESGFVEFDVVAVFKGREEFNAIERGQRVKRSAR